MAVAASQDWHKSKELYEAVSRFHDKYARQPQMDYEKGIHERNTKEIETVLRDEGICQKMEYTGSSYEGVKVAKSADNKDIEFDVMVIMNGGKKLVEQQLPSKPGYAFLKLRDPNTSGAALLFQTGADGIVSPKDTTRMFFSKLQLIINSSSNMNGKIRLINHGPAVQMDVYEDRIGGKKLYSVDMVPTFEIGDGAEKKMYVSKPIKLEDEACNAWRRSFSLQEKGKFVAMDRDNGCRKKVMRILKVLRNREPGLTQLTSYHLKTSLFKEVDDPQNSWSYDMLAARLMGVLRRISDDLSGGCMQHYFLPEINLLEGMTTACKNNIRDRINRLLSSKEEFMKIMNS